MPVLLCDLDDTLFDHEGATRDALEHLRGGYQVLTQWSLDELDQRHRVLLEAIHLDVLNGRLTIDEARRERFGRLLTQAGLDDPAATATLAAAYREAYASHWQPVPGAIEFLRAVRAAGYAIVIVTNNGVAEQQLKLARCGFDVLNGRLTIDEARRERFGRLLTQPAWMTRPQLRPSPRRTARRTPPTGSRCPARSSFCAQCARRDTPS